jgi:hypothetical protein
MGRKHVGDVIRVCLSPTKVATATGLHFDRVISPAIAAGELPVYLVAGNHRRILISDLEKWLRSFPIATTRKRKVLQP